MASYEIVPSLLSANFLNLNQELEKCQNENIKWIHYDVMDYDFVPNLTFGAKILSDIVKAYDFKIDIHFMVKVKTKKFEDFFDSFLKTKPFMMTMHIESMTNFETEKFIKLCHENNILASLAIKPSTPISKITKFLKKIDNVLIMSVDPGFGGQKFIEDSIPKIMKLKNIIDLNKYKCSIEIDGGINKDTIKKVKKTDIDLVVAGSYLFETNDFKKRIESLKNE